MWGGDGWAGDVPGVSSRDRHLPWFAADEIHLVHGAVFRTEIAFVPPSSERPNGMLGKNAITRGCIESVRAHFVTAEGMGDLFVAAYQREVAFHVEALLRAVGDRRVITWTGPDPGFDLLDMRSPAPSDTET